MIKKYKEVLYTLYKNIPKKCFEMIKTMLEFQMKNKILTLTEFRNQLCQHMKDNDINISFTETDNLSFFYVTPCETCGNRGHIKETCFQNKKNQSTRNNPQYHTQNYNSLNYQNTNTNNNFRQSSKIKCSTCGNTNQTSYRCFQTPSSTILTIQVTILQDSGQK